MLIKTLTKPQSNKLPNYHQIIIKNEHINQALCSALTEYNNSLIEYIPSKFHTQAMYTESIEKCPHILAKINIREDMRAEVYEKLLKNDKIIPGHYSKENINNFSIDNFV